MFMSIAAAALALQVAPPLPSRLKARLSFRPSSIIACLRTRRHAAMAGTSAHATGFVIRMAICRHRIRPQGSATIGFRVTPEGLMADCWIVRTSGDSSVDAIVCQAASAHMRFSPARDRDGRAIGFTMTYTPTWSPY